MHEKEKNKTCLSCASAAASQCVCVMFFFKKRKAVFVNDKFHIHCLYPLFSTKDVSLFFFLSLMFTHQRDKNSKSNEQ